MDKTALVVRILACPDCKCDLDGDLACIRCGRFLVPEEDGIIDALPATMGADRHTRDQLRFEIEREGPGTDADSEKIVLYERAFHDEQAAYYDKLFADPLPLGEYYRHLVRRQIHRYIRQQEFVVDLCCGTGKSSMQLLEQRLFVAAFDVSREMLRLYKRKCDAKGFENVVFINADATRPPLRARSCGAITIVGGLHHIQEQTACMEACRDALAEDGVLILHEPLKSGRTSRAACILEFAYAVTDPHRLWNAARNRLGLRRSRAVQGDREPPLADFTPYERPFTSAGELLRLIPPELQPVALRSQGSLSFRTFAPYLQGPIGRPLAALIVHLDDWLARRADDWTGDALFAVFQKSTVAH